MNNQPKILVLGATGKVGGETLRQLQLAGDSQPIAAIRSAEKAKALQAQGFETVILDLDQPDTLEPALQGIDRALLLTGYSVDMLRQSKRFLDAAKTTGVNHIVILVHPQRPPMKLPTGAGIKWWKPISNKKALVLCTYG